MLIVKILGIWSRAATCVIDPALGCVPVQILLRARLSQYLGFRVVIAARAHGPEKWRPTTLF